MKLIMAVSRDGFVARGPGDDMLWTGRADKFAFRLLTMSDGEPLLAGRRTAEMMPKLPNRQLLALSRNGLTLASAVWHFPQAWLIGGAEIALAALEMKEVRRAFVCRSPAVLGSGISAAPLFHHLPASPVMTIKLEEYEVDVYTEDQQWPVR